MTRLFLIFVLFSISGFAQDQMEQTIIIHAGTLLSNASEQARTKQSIIIKGEKIRAIQDGFIKIKDTEVIDLSSATVLPGLIDTHIHLQFSGATIKRDLVHMEDGVATLRAYTEANKSLRAGFTTLRDMGGDPDITFALRDAINQGYVQGPRILAAGPVIMPTGGGVIRGFRHDVMAMLKDTNLEYPCDGADECRKAVRQLIKDGADLIKVVATASITAPGKGGFSSQMTLEELQAIVETAHTFNKKVSAHAHGLEGINMALKAGVDSIEHGTFGDKSSIKLYKKAKAFLVPTPLDGLARMARSSSVMLPAQKKKILDANDYWFSMLDLSYQSGVKVTFGSDINVGSHGKNAQKFQYYKEAGMSNADIIRSATVLAADLLGLGDEIGTIESGKVADIIATKGNPIEEITELSEVSFVMKSGAVIHNKNH